VKFGDKISSSCSENGKQLEKILFAAPCIDRSSVHSVRPWPICGHISSGYLENNYSYN